MTISDTTFLKKFEDQTLSPDYFNHYGHLRLTWLYLKMFPLETAIDKVTNGISAYANSLGAKDKFQHTLTEAIVRIMASRLKQHNESSIEEYLDNNRDLEEDLWRVISEHYSKERLTSDKAIASFVEADLKPFD